MIAGPCYSSPSQSLPQTCGTYVELKLFNIHVTMLQSRCFSSYFTHFRAKQLLQLQHEYCSRVLFKHWCWAGRAVSVDVAAETMSSSRLQGFPVEVNQRVVSQFQVFFHNFLGWNERHFSELLPLCYGNIFCAVWIPYCCSIFHSCSDGGRRGLRVEILVIQRRLASAIVIETKLQLFGYARESDADSASCM